jgi:hypothetical protein
VVYLTDEIDEGATRRRLDEITSAGRRALEEHAERAAAIDAKFRQDQAKIDEAVKAMDQVVAEARAKQEPKDDKEEQPQNQWATRDAKPTVHAFGGEEFTQSAPPPPPPPMPGPPPVAPPAPPVEVAPDLEPAPRSRLMSLGFEEDEPQPEPPAAPPPMARPAARRPEPADDDDDDLSDVNWMR